MLVLSRKANQEIIIGDEVKITIVRVKGNTVRIGIEAPREMAIARGELLFQNEFEIDVDELKNAGNDDGFALTERVA